MSKNDIRIWLEFDSSLRMSPNSEPVAIIRVQPRIDSGHAYLSDDCNEYQDVERAVAGIKRQLDAVLEEARRKFGNDFGEKDIEASKRRDNRS